MGFLKTYFIFIVFKPKKLSNPNRKFLDILFAK